MQVVGFKRSIVHGFLGLSVGASACMGSLLATDEPQDRATIVKGHIGVAPASPPTGRYEALETYRVALTKPNSLGISLAKADEAIVSQLGLKSGEAHVVTQVQPKSLGEKAGIKLHDILLEVDGKPLKSPEALEPSLYSPGDNHPKLSLLRKGKRTTLEVTDLTRTKPTTARYWLGIPVSPVEGPLREQLGLEEKSGLLITDVTPDSPAKKAGIQKHDILLKIDQKAIQSAEQLVEEIQNSEGQPLKLNLLRSGKPLRIEVTPEKRTEQYIAQFYGQLNPASAPFVVQDFQVQPGLLLDAKTLDGLKLSRLQLDKGVELDADRMVIWNKNDGPRSTTDPRSLQRIETLLKQSQDLLKQIKSEQEKEIQSLQAEIKKLKADK